MKKVCAYTACGSGIMILSLLPLSGIWPTVSRRLVGSRGRLCAGPAITHIGYSMERTNYLCVQGVVPVLQEGIWDKTHALHFAS